MKMGGKEIAFITWKFSKLTRICYYYKIFFGLTDEWIQGLESGYLYGKNLVKKFYLSSLGVPKSLTHFSGMLEIFSLLGRREK